MKTIRKCTLVLLALLLTLSLVACADVEKTGVWEQATYVSDKTFGSGEKTVAVEVKAEDQSVTLTLKTDAETLGEALKEHDLIAGEEGPYGLYVKTVNGILADFEDGGWWWSLTKNGEAMMVGVDGAAIADGEHYELTRTK